MQEPLRAIFEVYEGRTGCHPMTKEERMVWTQAQAILGEDMIDKMVHAQSRSLAEAQYACFQEGFRLGVRLMREMR